LDWKHYADISNAIIDTAEYSNHNYQLIFDQLDELGCEHIQLRFFDSCSFESLLAILPLLDGTGILSIDLLTKYNPQIANHDYRRLLYLFPRITQWLVHSAPQNETLDHSDPCFEMVPLICTTQILNSESHCGAIHPGYFTINIETFTEAHQSNSCLNKKISIDKYGDIKNCPSMKKSYGKVGKVRLDEIIRNSTLKENWAIHKDQVSVCQDCEFRYICTDCRAYTEKEDVLGKPLKCNYNPYEGNGN